MKSFKFETFGNHRLDSRAKLYSLQKRRNVIREAVMQMKIDDAVGDREQHIRGVPDLNYKSLLATWRNFLFGIFEARCKIRVFLALL